MAGWKLDRGEARTETGCYVLGPGGSSGRLDQCGSGGQSGGGTHSECAMELPYKKLGV